MLTEACSPKEADVVPEMDYVPMSVGDEWVKLADASSGAVVATVPSIEGSRREEGVAI